MSALRALAPAKVNLCLLVGRPDRDGMHPLVSVVQPLSLADELVLAPAPEAAGDEVLCPGVDGPNLAERALAAYRAASGWDGPPQRLSIGKRIPVAAGMGGGSADAAGALRLAAAAAGRPGDPAVREVAPRLGSDVPAMLLARRCLLTSRGERVEPLDGPVPPAVLVLPSHEALSTPAVYRQFDALGGGRSPDALAGAAQALRAAARAEEDGKAGRATDVGHLMWVNDLQDAARRLCPSIDAALDDARGAGADVAMVSGSGPTVVGLFLGEEGRERAQVAAAALRARHPRAVVATPVGAGYADPRPA